jgi:CHASE2 domain-containing sensor protein
MRLGQILGIAITVFVTIISAKRVLEPFELSALDFRYAFVEREPQNPNIKVVLIDDHTVSQIGRFPFPRDLQALLLDILSTPDYRPKAIGFDILFAEEGDPMHDALFSECTESAQNVYHAISFHFLRDQKNGELPKRFGYPSDGKAREAIGFTSSLPSLIENAKGIGHTNIFSERDGKIRRIPLLIRYRDRLYPSMALALASDYLEVEDVEADENQVVLKREKEGDIVIPVDKDCNMWIYFRKTALDHELEADSFIELLQSDLLIKEGKKPLVSLFDYKGKIVIVGSVATGRSDLCATPLSPVYPSVGLYVNAMSNIIEQRFLRRAGLTTNIAICLFIGMVMAFWLPKISPKSQGLFSGALLLLYTISAISLFRFYKLWVDMVCPISLILSEYIVITVYSYEKERSFLKSIIKSTKEALERKQEELSIVYEKILKRMGPQEVAEEEVSLSLNLDFRQPEISHQRRVLASRDPAFLLLKQFIRKDLSGKTERFVHWLSGYTVFSHWDAKNPKDPAQAFAGYISLINHFFRKKVIGSTVRGRRGKGYYQLLIRPDRYQSNITLSLKLSDETEKKRKESALDEAEKKGREAIELDPENMNAYKVLAEIYDEMGDKDGAKRVYQRYHNLILSKIKSLKRAILSIESHEWEERLWDVVELEKGRMEDEARELEEERKRVEEKIGTEVQVELTKPELKMGVLREMAKGYEEGEDVSKLFERVIQSPFYSKLLEDTTERAMRLFRIREADRKKVERMALACLYEAILVEPQIRIDIATCDEHSFSQNIKRVLTSSLHQQLEKEGPQPGYLPPEIIDRIGKRA